MQVGTPPIKKVRNLLVFLYQSILVVWLLNSTYWIAKLLVTNQLLFTQSGNQISYCDFVLYYMAGKLFSSATPEKLYDAATQLQFLNTLTAPFQITHIDLLVYPPFFFAAMSLFAAIPIMASFVIWCFTGSCLSLYFCFLLLKENKFLADNKTRILFMIGIAIFLPFFQSLQVGYTSQFLLAFVAAFFYFWLKGRDSEAAFFLALSAFKPQYLFFLLMPSLACKRFKVLFMTGAILVSFFALCALRIGLENIIGYPLILLHTEHGGNINQMVNVRGLLTQFADQKVVIPVSGIAFFGGMGLVFFTWLKVNAIKATSDASLRNRAEHWAIAITVISALLFGQHSHLSDCTLLIIAAALTMQTVSLPKGVLRYALSLRIWHLVFLLSPVMSIALFVWWSVLGQWHNMTLDPYLIFNIVLFLSAILYFFKSDGLFKGRLKGLSQTES